MEKKLKNKINMKTKNEMKNIKNINQNKEKVEDICYFTPNLAIVYVYLLLVIKTISETNHKEQFRNQHINVFSIHYFILVYILQNTKYILFSYNISIHIYIYIKHKNINANEKSLQKKCSMLLQQSRYTTPQNIKL